MSIIVKSKARVFGESINTHEFLQALKNPLFPNDDSPISLSSQTFSDALTMVYICLKCAKLHLVCGGLNEGEEVSKENIIVLVDHTTDGEYVTKREMIHILENLNEIRNVCLQHIYGPMTYTLTEISKCNEHCPAVHLDSAYHKDCVYLT